MAANTMSTTARIGKYAGGILKHAVPHEVLARGGCQVTFPKKNNSNTYGSSLAAEWHLRQFNQWQSADRQRHWDRAAALVAAAQTSEGVTPTPDQITPQDQTVVPESRLSVLFTDQVHDLYEDDIPGAIKEQIGERVAPSTS